MKKTHLITLVLLAVMMLGVLAVAALGKSSKSNGDPWLGVYVDDVTRKYAKRHDLPYKYGVIIEDIIRKSPAYNSELEEDDVIIAFDGEQVFDGDDLTYMIEDADLDKEVVLTVIRDGEEKKINVQLEKRPRKYKYDISSGNYSNLYFDDDDDDNEIIIRTGPGGHNYHWGDDRPFIGVKLQNLSRQLGEFFGVKRGKGALITEVYKDSPAETSGIKAGDVIVSIDSDRIFDIEDVLDFISDYDPGDTVEITVIRDRNEKKFNVEIAESDDFDLDYDNNIYFHGSRLPSLPSLPALPALPSLPSLPSLSHTCAYIDEDFDDDLDLHFLYKGEFQKEMKELQQELKEMQIELKNDLKNDLKFKTKKNLKRVY